MAFGTFKEIQATLVWLESHNPTKVDEFCLMMRLERIKEDVSITFSKPTKTRTMQFKGCMEMEVFRQRCIREENRLNRQYAEEMSEYLANSFVFFDGDEARPGRTDGLDSSEVYYCTQKGYILA